MMRFKRRSGLAMAASAVLSLGMFSMPAAAQEKVNFSGETIELWVPFDTGGGTDRFVRMFQPFLEKYLPGNPTVVVFNKPGGASITAANQFHNSAPNDGTALLGVSISTLFAQVLGDAQVKFDPTEWRSLIVAPHGGVLYANASMTGMTGEDFEADLKRLVSEPRKFGMKIPKAAGIRAYLSYDILGVDVQSIFGLGRSDNRQALIRNELDLSYDSMGAYLDHVVPYVEKGAVVPIATFGRGTDYERDTVLPDVPTLKEAYETLHGNEPEGIAWRAATAILDLSGSVSKALVLPPGTPD